MGSKKLPLVSKPLGDSEKRNWEYYGLSFEQDGGPCICELCGTENPASAEDAEEVNTDDGLTDTGSEDEGDDDSFLYHIIKLFGYRIVLECCGGALLDSLYSQLGGAFCHIYIRDEAERPTEPAFSYLLSALEGDLRLASEKLRKTDSAVTQAYQAVEAVQKERGSK